MGYVWLSPFSPLGLGWGTSSPDSLKALQGPPQPSGGVIVSSTLIAFLAQQIAAPPPPPLCLNSFTCSHFYDALILPPKLLVFFTGLTFTTNEDAASPSYGSRSSASVRGTWGQCQTYLAHVGHLLNKCIVTEKSSSGSSHRWGWRYSYTAEFYSTSLSVLFMTVTCWVEHGPCHGWHKSIHLQVKDSMLSRWGAPQVARLF